MIAASTPTFRLMNEEGLAQLSNRVVAVTDEEPLLVEMQHVRRCGCYQSGICVLLCQNRVEYGILSIVSFRSPEGGQTACV